MDYRPPKPSNLNSNAISRFAEDFAQRALYTPGGNMEETVGRIGGRLLLQEFWNLDSSDSGSIQVEPDGKFTIYIARHTSLTRDRFTVAHELGHFGLHFLLPRASNPNQDLNWGLRASRYGSGRTEVEANVFAAAFVMPEQLFKTVFNETGNNIAWTAEHFGVSVSAATIRASNLGLPP